MNNFGEFLDQSIKLAVGKVLSEGEMPDTVYIETDNLGEVVEKLCILHIRTWMLEDAAQAHLATYKSQPVGTYGTAAFSFYPTKNMTSGEGGMIVTSDDEVAR